METTTPIPLPPAKNERRRPVPPLLAALEVEVEVVEER
jgi:hypothetical protein